MSERTSIERKTLFKTNYLFIDGMSRSGKFTEAALTLIRSSFEEGGRISISFNSTPDKSSSIELQTNAIHFVLKALPQLYFFYTKD